MFDQIKISQLNLDILTEQEKETCVLAVDINSNKNKDKIISKLQQKIAIEIFLQKQVIDYNLVDALRAYFQQIYDLEGLLLTVLLCYQEDMLSKELVTYLKSFFLVSIGAMESMAITIHLFTLIKLAIPTLITVLFFLI